MALNGPFGAGCFGPARSNGGCGDCWARRKWAGCEAREGEMAFQGDRGIYFLLLHFLVFLEH